MKLNVLIVKWFYSYSKISIVPMFTQLQLRLSTSPFKAGCKTRNV